MGFTTLNPASRHERKSASWRVGSRNEAASLVLERLVEDSGDGVVVLGPGWPQAHSGARGGTGRGGAHGHAPASVGGRELRRRGGWPRLRRAGWGGCHGTGRSGRSAP